MAQLNQSKDSIQNMVDTRNDQILDYIISFNVIQQNLDSIKNVQKILDVSLNSGNVENRIKEKDQILNDIALINNLLNQNKSLVASLKKKLKESNLKSADLEKMIQNYVLQINEKDNEIAELNGELGRLKIDISNLNQKIDELAAETMLKSETIEYQMDKMNEVFYCFGTKDELIRNNIVEKTGGFLGMGKSISIKADFNHDYFSKVDQRNFSEVILMAKTARLLSVHPESSFHFTTNEDDVVENLIIDQPAEFWKASKYMIIVVEQ
ncbi:MAG: hypothetical protein ACERKD_05410 [Prolixibacteraceae bacterium]